MQDHELRRMEPPLTWDHTMRSTRKQCIRKLYFFLRRFDYDSQNTPSYFVYGRAFGAGLRKWYDTPYAAAETQEGQRRAAVAVADALSLWDSEGATDTKLDTRDNLKRKLLRYFERWPKEPWSVVPAGAEAGWQWPLPGTSFFLGGSMDAYIEWPGYGFLPREDKTTGTYLSPSYMGQWHFSQQVMQYVWYLNQLRGGQDVYGALLNAATKNFPGPRSKWNHPEFDRTIIKKEPWDLEEFEEDVTYEITEFMNAQWSDWYWPKTGRINPINCTGGIGKAPCLFRGICASPLRPEEVDPKRFVGIVERETVWEPWKRQGEDLQ